MSKTTFFTQAKVQEFLSQVFFGIPYSKNIVPMQGNIRNPQDGADEREPITWLTRSQIFDPKGNMKPDTWIGFLKTDSDPRVMAAYGTDAPIPGQEQVTFSRVFVNSNIRLQIVGTQSEEWAESVKHWLQRGFVVDTLVGMDAQLYADGLGRIEVSPFYQDGLNSILAYNVFFKVEWASTIDADSSVLWKQAEIPGTVVPN